MLFWQCPFSTTGDNCGESNCQQSASNFPALTLLLLRSPHLCSSSLPLLHLHHILQVNFRLFSTQPFFLWHHDRRSTKTRHRNDALYVNLKVYYSKVCFAKCARLTHHQYPTVYPIPSQALRVFFLTGTS